MEHVIEWTPTPRQLEAWDYLHDQTTLEVFFGGGAGGGKSTLGCAWILKNCLQFPGSRWVMGREKLHTLKQSTFLTLLRLCKEWGLKRDKQFHFAGSDNVVHFYNGSEIYLKDFFLYPSDPEFDAFGSTEYTGAFIDEGSQIAVKAKNVIISRLRFNHRKYGIKPKLLICSNPAKNFLHFEFYKPWKDGTLPPHRKFVQALVNDNPHIDPAYIENLHLLDPVTRNRLLHGDWDFDDDPTRLMQYDKILDIFTSKLPDSKDMYITCDVARYGADKTAIMVWKGMTCVKAETHSKKGTRDTRILLEFRAGQFGVPRSNIIIDDDGVGGGVVDELPGVRGFQNGGRPLRDENYQNLKTQCYFFLSEAINTGRIAIASDAITLPDKSLLIEELEQVRRKDPDRDGRLMLVPKDEIKERLGRSPDLSDAMMMRMWFEAGSYGTPAVTVHDNLYPTRFLKSERRIKSITENH